MTNGDQTNFGLAELFDTRPAVAVLEVEYKRLLGYPFDFVLEGRARELADWARAWYAEYGRPWIYARPAANLEIANGWLRVNGTGFRSKQLYDQLHEAREQTVMLGPVSAGKECEGKPLQLLDRGKSAR